MSALIGIAAIAVVAWFAAGTAWNVRKGRAIMRWMQDGLPRLGSRTTVRWLGSTVVELSIQEAQPPFVSATIVIFLAPRDLPWGALLGRRDTLIFRGKLQRQVTAEFEALDPKTWSGREALSRLPREWTARAANAAAQLLVHHSEPGAFARADALIATARDANLGTMRLSARQSDPNFQLHVIVPDTHRPARPFFEAVRALAENAAA